MNVAILGASDKPDRYAYKAFRQLRAHGHKVFLVNPQVQKVEDTPVLAKLKDITEPIDTLTMYVGPRVSSSMMDEILNFKIRRVIFNPGSENEELIQQLVNKGVHVEEACTLVMLSLETF